MSYNLDPKKEEEVKALLKTHSFREIVKKTGVAVNTITRIRNENFTEEEKAELAHLANLRGRSKRELQKRTENIPLKIPKQRKTTSERGLEIYDKKNFETSKPPLFDFVDITRKYVAYLVKRKEELTAGIKKLTKELAQARTHLYILEDFLVADENDKELSEDRAFREFIEVESELLDMETEREEETPKG